MENEQIVDLDVSKSDESVCVRIDNMHVAAKNNDHRVVLLLSLKKNKTRCW